MASRNRGRYSSYNASRNSGLAFARGAFVLLVVLVLSFGLGFFVIARMVPGAPKPEGGNGTPISATNRPDTDSQENANKKSSPPSTTPSNQDAPHTAPPAAKPPAGPTIDPEDEVQKPDKLDPNSDSTNTIKKSDDANGDAVPSDPADKTDPKHPGDPSAADKNSSGGDTPPTRTRRRSRRHASDTEVQPAGKPGESTGDSTDTPDTSGRSAEPANGESAATKPAHDGLYRVQIGVYSTREKAEEIAKDARDRGFKATVKTIEREGRTLYRVQHSAHQDRAKAEADQQRLNDAGFDA